MRLPLLLAGLILAMATQAAERPGFQAGSSGEYRFDTGRLKGVLRAGGVSKGLSEVVHTPTGRRLDSSMGWLSPYRVFTRGKRYGAGAWDWPSQARLQTDGSVRVHWPAADRPFELWGDYRWVSADTLELQIEVKAGKDPLPGFEVFVASYFSTEFTNSQVATGGGTDFTVARREAGVWQAFPRDAQAAAVIRDGRWHLEPHPVDWVIRGEFSPALGLRGAPASGILAGVMGDPVECFAICTPYETEEHYSTYVSLFGRDIPAGGQATARVRLRITEQESPSRFREVYAEFARSLAAAR